MYGVDDGARTHDDRNHNPGLYQLSYVHHSSFICWRLFGTPGRIRTCYPRLRRPMLYPSELQAQNFKPETYILISIGTYKLTKQKMVGVERLLRTSCPAPFRPRFARSKSLPAILYSGLLPCALRAALCTFKIAPGDFVGLYRSNLSPWLASVMMPSTGNNSIATRLIIWSG